MKVLITRDASQAGGLQAKLENIGAKVACVPTISIQDPDDWSLFDHATKDLLLYDWVLFTSANAVKQSQKRLSELKIDLNSFPNLKFGAVGKQTAELILEAGWNVDIVPQKYQAEGLLEELIQRKVSGKKFWFPRALHARKYLIPELITLGADVTLTPVYQNKIPLENAPLLQEH